MSLRRLPIKLPTQGKAVPAADMSSLFLTSVKEIDAQIQQLQIIRNKFKKAVMVVPKRTYRSVPRDILASVRRIETREMEKKATALAQAKKAPWTKDYGTLSGHPLSLFMKDHFHAEKVAAGPGKSKREIISLLHQRYKAMSETERAPYLAKAAENRQIRQQEARKIKIISPYQLFVKENAHAAATKLGGQRGFQQSMSAMRLLAAAWKAMPEEMKATYSSRSAEMNAEAKKNLQKIISDVQIQQFQISRNKFKKTAVTVVPKRAHHYRSVPPDILASVRRIETREMERKKKATALAQAKKAPWTKDYGTLSSRPENLFIKDSFHAEKAAAGPGKSAMEIISILRQRYKAMSETERAPYLAKAAENRQIRQQEARKIKIISPYQLFVKENAHAAATKLEGQPGVQKSITVFRLLAAAWKAMPEEMKATYSSRSAEMNAEAKKNLQNIIIA